MNFMDATLSDEKGKTSFPLYQKISLIFVLMADVDVECWRVNTISYLISNHIPVTWYLTEDAGW